VASEV